MEAAFSSPAYRRSRAAYVGQCTLEYYISILSTDVYLSKLLKYIGCSDAFTGVLSSVISFAFLFQLLSVPLAGRLRRVKKTVTALDTASQLLFTALYAVPFLPLGFGGRAGAVTALLLAAYFTFYLNQSVAYKWGNSFVEPGRRARFSANKEMISLITGVAFTLGAGFVTDRLEQTRGLPAAFVFLGCCMAAVSAANLGCFSLMRDMPVRETTRRQTLRDILRDTLGNRRFLAAAALTSLSEFARYTVVGFLGTYKTEELGLSVSRVQLINVAAALCRFAVSRPFGSFSDRTTYAKGYLAGNLLTALSFLCGIFASPAAKWMIVPATVLYHMSFAGTNQNTFHMVYAFVPEDSVMPALAVNNSIRGVSGFAASLCGGRILSAVQNRGNLLFGRTVYGQQLLHLIALLVILAAIVFNKTVVMKQKEERK